VAVGVSTEGGEAEEGGAKACGLRRRMSRRDGHGAGGGGGFGQTFANNAPSPRKPLTSKRSHRPSPVYNPPSADTFPSQLLAGAKKVSIAACLC
jgi:hypothetical protein